MNRIFFVFLCKYLKVIFRKSLFNFGAVSVHLMTFPDFDPADFLDKLTDIEKERYFSFSNLQRKREFVATRLLRHDIFGHQHIHYDEIGAPFIKDEGFISISHSKNIVGISICKDFKLGLDIEEQNKPKKKFLKLLNKLCLRLKTKKIWSKLIKYFNIKIIFRKSIIICFYYI